MNSRAKKKHKFFRVVEVPRIVVIPDILIIKAGYKCRKCKKKFYDKKFYMKHIELCGKLTV